MEKTFYKRVKNHVIWMLGNVGAFDHLSDEAYLRLMFRLRLGRKLDLKNPKSYNEKIQWLKLYDRNPIYTTLVDKYEVKKYVADRIGEQYIIPTLGVWDKFEDIDFAKLPDQFVLKTTHDSGGVVICKDKRMFDITAARKKLERSLHANYYMRGREWPYKNVKPRIIAEQYMVDESGYELKDYKIFCFDGFAKAMFIATDRQVEGEETKFDFYDMNFKHLPFTNRHPNATHEIKRPKSFDEMKMLAEKLSQGIPQVRVDFYDINGKVYFGELTLSHWSGMIPFEPEERDYKFGEWIKLPENIGGGYLIAAKGWILYCHREDKGKEDLADYKVWNFNGEPHYIQYITGRNSGDCREGFYTTDWKLQKFSLHNALTEKVKEKPVCLEEMLNLSRKLAEGTFFSRTDFYVLRDGSIRFGEITFFPMSGLERWHPEEMDQIMGKKIILGFI